MAMRYGLVLLLVLWHCTLAGAAEIAPELQTLIDAFSEHRRTASGYLRTGNPELGSIEIERLRAHWSRAAANVPPAIARQPQFRQMLAETEQSIVKSLAAADGGDFDAAQSLLDRAAETLRRWRLANGIRLFSDCIAEIGDAYAVLDRHRVKPPNLMAAASTAEQIVAEAAVVEAALRKCDGEATAAIRGLPEFRRLVDGMIESLRQVPQAIGRRDPAYLHRLLIEQRSFERLLTFRFG